MKIAGIKTFPIQMTEQLNKEIKEAAAKEGIPMYEFIFKAIEERVNNQNK